MGTAGPQVRQVQRMLAHLGYPVGKVDGKFGVRTQRAVIAFQSANELPIDGVVATNTWMALERRAGILPEPEEVRSEPMPVPELVHPPLPEQQPEPLIPPMPPMILPPSPPTPSCPVGARPPIQIMPLIEWVSSTTSAAMAVPQMESEAITEVSAPQREMAEESWGMAEPEPTAPPEMPPASTGAWMQAMPEEEMSNQHGRAPEAEAPLPLLRGVWTPVAR